MQSIFVALCIVGIVGAVAQGWVNDFDKPFTFSCRPGERWYIITTRRRKSWNTFPTFETTIWWKCEAMLYCLHFLGKMIGSFYSVHSNLHEDRRWKIGCWRNTPVAPRWWSPAINFHREYFVFVCPFQSALSGMAGVHSNKFEDRRFRFHCTQRKFKQTRRCWWSSYLNRFDHVFRFVTPRGTYISGIKAQYSRFHK